MKKSIMAVGALALLFAVSGCKSDKGTTDTASETPTETVTDEKTDEADAADSATGATTVATDSVAGTPASTADDKKDDKMTWLPSGLGYKVIKEGKGAMPTVNDVVKVKYTGKHLDGSVFDSSGDQTVDFPLTRVIKGFSEGITHMNRGAVYELYIPSKLGYGEMGTPGGPIAPNEDLIFEIELVDF